MLLICPNMPQFSHKVQCVCNEYDATTLKSDLSSYFSAYLASYHCMIGGTSTIDFETKEIIKGTDHPRTC